ncbi:RNA polymerase sigma-70 factor, ECF subfamily [Sphingobacterium nematocida]|uniref:RNA polymerase sigma-70 factor, ECF subfamily n=1 Tax=Sphingobacterium nematocida TaxID=1513896 RepID=A0A1T5FGS2_9SPHI|nr:RNA polymerase sigma-70 factor [Sphingobacterium nematocida]SKB95312.1 RNA polymerase sigma-70 factor, ECF subfamily [Sphingobacterium nematocida]
MRASGKDLSLLSDQELIPLLRDGIADAYTTMYGRHAGFVFTVAMKMVKDEDEAYDLVQDIFTKIWEQGSLDIQTEIKPYLYRVTRNRILNQINRNKFKEQYFDSLQVFLDSGVWTTEEKILENEMELRIEQELAALPNKMRQVFELSRKENRSYKEIAEELGVSEETVRKQIHRALKILRSRLTAIFFTFFI